jgi:hypothetical protein
MIKWFLYIVILIILAPRLSSAKNSATLGNNLIETRIPFNTYLTLQRDTVVTKSKQHPSDEDKKKIKEVAKAKKMPKPEKVEPADASKPQTKPKRQRRPDGLVRPPEIPRRNNN